MYPSSASAARLPPRENSRAVFLLPAPPPPRIPIALDSTAPVGSYAARRRVEVVLGGIRTGNGSCVAYAQSRGFDIHGWAKDFLAKAPAAGYRTSRQPVIGAIAVTSESSSGTYTGHVTGPITRIEGVWTYQCEQNYIRATVTCGWLDSRSGVILGYVLPKPDAHR